MHQDLIMITLQTVRFCIPKQRHAFLVHGPAKCSGGFKVRHLEVRKLEEKDCSIGT